MKFVALSQRLCAWAGLVSTGPRASGIIMPLGSMAEGWRSGLFASIGRPLRLCLWWPRPGGIGGGEA